MHYNLNKCKISNNKILLQRWAPFQLKSQAKQICKALETVFKISISTQRVKRMKWSQDKIQLIRILMKKAHTNLIHYIQLQTYLPKILILNSHKIGAMLWTKLNSKESKSSIWSKSTNRTFKNIAMSTKMKEKK